MIFTTRIEPGNVGGLILDGTTGPVEIEVAPERGRSRIAGRATQTQGGVSVGKSVRIRERNVTPGRPARATLPRQDGAVVSRKVTVSVSNRGRKPVVLRVTVQGKTGRKVPATVAAN